MTFYCAFLFVSRDPRLRRKNALVSAAMETTKDQFPGLISRLGITQQDLDDITAVFHLASCDIPGKGLTLEDVNTKIFRSGESTNDAEETKNLEGCTAILYGEMEELD